MPTEPDEYGLLYIYECPVPMEGGSCGERIHDYETRQVMNHAHVVFHVLSGEGEVEEDGWHDDLYAPSDDDGTRCDNEHTLDEIVAALREIHAA